jgi:hypothetical protein
MRIDGNSRTQSMGLRTVPSRVSGGGGFAVEEGSARASSAEVGQAGSLMDINALMALQSVDDALHARRKAVRRGTGLLDALDEVKTDLLIGRVSEGRLNQMLSIIGQARERTMPGLDAVLDDIELRARVELAKFGHYAAA